MDIKDLTVEKVVEYMNPWYDLSYIEYDSDMSDNLENVQEAIQKQDYCPLDEIVDDEWFRDMQWESVDTIKKELITEISNNLGLEGEDDVEKFFENNREDIEQYIYDRDTSTPLDDLMRHTSDQVMFYDTGLYIESSDYDDELMNDNVHAIKNLLGIADNKYDETILSLINEASYGGRLVVYFMGDIKDMMKIGDNNTITFENADIAIIDNYNGSGSNETFSGLKFSLPLNTENIFIDKTLKYNYSFDVCGMVGNWCDNTYVSFSKSETVTEVPESSLHAFSDREAELNKTFKDGGCTLGDMDINRHRNTYYQNDFPCGTHCPKCGTFWID